MADSYNMAAHERNETKAPHHDGVESFPITPSNTKVNASQSIPEYQPSSSEKVGMENKDNIYGQNELGIETFNSSDEENRSDDQPRSRTRRLVKPFVLLTFWLLMTGYV